MIFASFYAKYIKTLRLPAPTNEKTPAHCPNGNVREKPFGVCLPSGRSDCRPTGSIGTGAWTKTEPVPSHCCIWLPGWRIPICSPEAAWTGRSGKKAAAALIRSGHIPDFAEIEELDRQFIRENLSPGGCADLLAAVYFLDHF